MLSYKTRLNSTPTGKPKIFFTAHPEEHATYLEIISEDVLETLGAAIWYDTDPARDVDGDGEFFEALSEMKLFIIAITPRLLREPSRALGTELAFAKDNHIPILPIVVESIDPDLYSRHFGSAQYLDRASRDSTAIAYKEKLARHLGSVLTGDDLAEKVRAAFDAYIFLSYRKKDRKYAKELMKLIHADDFCRDVAIWYDEYLTPGENFNDAIVEAFEKSKLFVLAVTPNVINEVNYVLTTEYPMAHSAHKPIIPVEMEKTDRALLEEGYTDLPPCISKEDGRGLSEELRKKLGDSLKRLAVTTTEESPEHTFFIGLAYFSGIDVEADVERGIKLIRTAAEKHLPEAVEKLVSIYKNGEGVERDADEAIRWWRRLHLDYYRAKDRLGDEWREKMHEANDSLAKFLADEGRVEEAASQYKKNLRASWGGRQIVILHEMGVFYESIGDRKSSLKYSRRAMKKARPYAKDYPDYYFPLVLGYLERCRSFGLISEAKKCLTELLPYVERLDGSNDTSMHNAAVLYEKLARIMLLEGDHKGALDMLEPALKLREAQYGTTERSLFIQGYFDLKMIHGYTLIALGRENEGVGVILSAEREARELCEKNSLPDLKRLLGYYTATLAEALIAVGRLTEAARLIESCGERMHVNMPRTKRLSLIASLAQRLGATDAALALTLEALGTGEAPLDSDDLLLLARLHKRASEYLKVQGRTFDAIPHLAKIKEYSRTISDGRIPELFDAAIVREKAETVSSGELAGAKAASVKAENASSTKLTDSKNTSTKAENASSRELSRTRDVSEKAENTSSIEALLLVFNCLYTHRLTAEASGIYEKILREADEPTYRVLGAHVASLRGDLSAAAENLFRAAELERGDKLGVKYAVAASSFYKKCGVGARAAECARFAADMAQNLVKSDPCRDFLGIYYASAVICALRLKDIGEMTEAFSVLERALSVLDQNLPEGEALRLEKHKHRRAVRLLAEVSSDRERYLGEADKVSEALSEEYIGRTEKLLGEKRFTEGERAARLVISLATEIKNRLGDLDSYIALANTLSRLSRIESDVYRFAEARAYKKRIVGVFRECVEKNATAYAFYRLAHAEVVYAESISRNSYSEGEEYFAAAHESIKRACELSDRDVYFRFTGEVLLSHATALSYKSSVHMRRAIRLAEEAIPYYQKYDTSADHKGYYDCCFLIAKSTRRLSERDKYFRIAYKLYKTYGEEVGCGARVLRTIEYAIRNGFSY